MSWIVIGKCFCCEKPVYLGRANGVLRIGGVHYYCKAKECQKRFIEDAGDPPEDWGTE